jgi:energy-coupling factor transporter ATP-binding protein EcfA2
MKRQIEDIYWLEVVWHRPFKLEAIYELLVHLASLTPRGAVIWEVRGCGGCVRYLLGAEHKYMGRIKEIFRTHGNMQFYHAPDHVRKAISTVRQLKISHPALSLKTDISLAAIRAGLAAMAAARDKEETVIQIVFGPSYAPSAISKHLPDPNASWLQIILGNAQQASPESRSSVKEKAQHHGFCATIRIGSSGENANNRILDIFSALKTLESAGIRMSAPPEKAGKINQGYVPWHFPLRLSVKELAHFLLLPAGEEELAGTAGLHPKPLPPPEWYRSPASAANSRAFAVSTNTSERKVLSISPQDSLEHTVLLGPTGTGKSTVMLHLALADIAAGRSVLVIDPKADLAGDILARIPEARKGDVVVIDPSDQCPVGFNPLAFKDYRNHPLIADAVLAVLKEIFSENWGIRSQDVLSAALLTLAEIEGSSLLWLPALLTDEGFRQKITAQVKDKVALKPFWEHFEAMKDSERRQETAPVMNKMRQFLLRPGLRGVLGQSDPKFKLTDLFHKRRIVLVPLNKGIIGGESARLLGSLIVGLTWTLALSRASIPRERRHIVSVYIDELQDYLALPTDLSDALSQARGLGVGITMAHQYREQLPPDIRAAIDANARNKIIFGLGGGDAKAMAAIAPGLQALDFVSLPRYRVYASFQNNGRDTGWVQGRTLPPPPANANAAEMKARSMSEYGKPAEDVEKELLAAIGQGDTDTPEQGDTAIGRRKIT